jgi:NADH-quinone oxidoreductase subunit E
MAKDRSKTAETEGSAAELAHKIWLAGVGAYGKAYDTAMASAHVINQQSAEMFDELVARGAEIENDVRSRLTADTRLNKASERVSKAVDTAREFQVHALDRFEARMERMRDLLGLKGGDTPHSYFARRVEKLEDEVSAVAAKARSRTADVDLKKRIARLTAEIEAVAGETGADLAKTARKARRKTVKAVKAAMAEPEGADDLTKISGIGIAMASKLGAEGIVRYSEIAALTKAEAEALDAKIGARGRVLRDNWVKQAKTLMGKKA